MYANGTGVGKNEREAANWYKKAADQGYAWGQYNLGRCYLYGAGVSRNNTTAKTWLTKAYKNNDTSAKKAADELWEGRKK
jgi:TPR repeat protein